MHRAPSYKATSYSSKLWADTEHVWYGVVKVSRQNDSGIGVLEAQAKGAGVCVSFE